MMMGMSQEKLGDAVDLTFQQIQKYEKGTNRIGSSRLQQFSDILRVPVSYFFDGGPSSGLSKYTVIGDARVETEQVDEFMATTDGLTLIGAFMKVGDAKVRRRLVDLVVSMAKNK